MSIDPNTTTHTVAVEAIGEVAVTVTSRGSGRPFLVLHGGAGPFSVTGFAEALAASGPAQVLTPTHPGFDGTSRAEALTDIRGLARVYVALLAELGLDDVIVLGNSIGGWIASEMAILAPASVSGFVLVDAVGIEDPENPPADFFSLTMSQVADLAYHRPDAFRLDVDALPPAAQELMASNQAALKTYAGTGMVDPTLERRLATVNAPVLVIWGESDRIVVPEYGRRLARSIPGARFQILTGTGHLPQLETPEQLLSAVRAFAGSV